MDEADKLPRKQTLLVGLAQVILGITAVLCNVAIHYLPEYDYPIKSSSYGIWGGLTFLLSGIAVMNATRGYSQAAVSTALATVCAGMGLVVMAIGSMAIHNGTKAVMNPEEEPVSSFAVTRLVLDIIITITGIGGFISAIASHKLTMKAFKKYLRELQEREAQEHLSEFSNVQVAFNAREGVCTVPIGPPAYSPPDDPHPAPPAYTEKEDTPPQARRLGTHQMNRSTESLVSSEAR